MLRECACREPVPSPNPRNQNTCLSCGWWLDPDAEWAVNDATHNSFLNRLEDTLRVAEMWKEDEPPPREWLRFRLMALQREQDGRERHGWDYLRRDNIAAGSEESSDAVNYAYFDMLQAQRRGDAVEMALVLQAAYYDYKAYQTRCELEWHRGGGP